MRNHPNQQDGGILGVGKRGRPRIDLVGYVGLALIVCMVVAGWVSGAFNELTSKRNLNEAQAWLVHHYKERKNHGPWAFDRVKCLPQGLEVEFVVPKSRAGKMMALPSDKRRAIAQDLCPCQLEPVWDMLGPEDGIWTILKSQGRTLARSACISSDPQCD